MTDLTHDQVGAVEQYVAARRAWQAANAARRKWWEANPDTCGDWDDYGHWRYCNQCERCKEAIRLYEEVKALARKRGAAHARLTKACEKWRGM